MTKMSPDDPAYWMLFDGYETVPVVHNPDCYICNDPEFAQMGLPLCTKCLICGKHVPADDCICDDGHVQPTCPSDEVAIREEYGLEVSDELRALAAQETPKHDPEPDVGRGYDGIHNSNFGG